MKVWLLPIYAAFITSYSRGEKVNFGPKLCKNYAVAVMKVKSKYGRYPQLHLLTSQNKNGNGSVGTLYRGWSVGAAFH